jgi:two-component system, response regulator YesN
MKLVIVEDEPALRSNMAEHIPWEKNGIEVVGLAGDGKEALELINRKMPDLLLLDIQMPEVDGLTLARQIRVSGLEMKIIILSGHDDFEFAQSALEVGVSRYLLKPALAEEILGAVTEAGRILQEERQRRHNQIQIENKWIENLPSLKNAFLQSWVNGKYTESEILRHSQSLGITIGESSSFGVLVVETDPLAGEELRFEDNDYPLLQFALHSIAEDTVVNQAGFVFQDTNYITTIIMIKSAEEDEERFIEKIHTAAGRLLSLCKDCLKLTASAGIGEVTHSVEGVHRSYIHAKQALSERVVYGQDIAIPYRENKNDLNNNIVDPGWEKQIRIGLEVGNAEEVITYMSCLINDRPENSSTVHVYERTLLANMALAQYIQSQGWGIHEVLKEDALYFFNLYELKSKEQILEWMKKVVHRIVSYSSKRRNTNAQELISSIITMIDSQLQVDINLYSISEKLHINSSYLSRLFKQHIGKPFSSFLFERKMERAMELLSEGAKVSEAANQVGYRDVSHFGKAFRKHWSITPGEVKRKSNSEG